jgi:hypothetical protein
MEIPETRYATRSDGVSIAYQVLGEGPVNLVFCAGMVSHLDLQWTNPGITHFFRRLASFSRLALYDKAGTGVSDPIANVPAPRGSCGRSAGSPCASARRSRVRAKGYRLTGVAR